MLRNDEKEIYVKCNINIKDKKYNLYLIFDKDQCRLKVYDNFENVFGKRLHSKNDVNFYDIIIDNNDKLYYKELNCDYIHRFNKKSINKIIATDYFRNFSYSLSYMIISQYNKELTKFYELVNKYMINNK